jgi:hypothetical protein
MHSKKNIKAFIFTLLAISIVSYAFIYPARSEYDISGFYVGAAVDDKTMGLTSDGLKEISAVMTPTNLDAGKYVVKVTRKGSNLYKIDGKNIFLETRYCYEYSTGDEVILTVESSYGYNKGKIKF